MKNFIKGALLVSTMICAAAPATAATTFDGVLGATGVTNYRFAFGGGSLQINVNSAGANPIGDPSQYVFDDDGSPDTALTGAFRGYNDDTGTLDSQLNLNLAAGNYVLSIGRFFFAETEARTFNASGQSAGTTYSVIFDQNVDLAGGVPEPSTWALLILGFGAVGVGMRRTKSVRTSLAYT